MPLWSNRFWSVVLGATESLILSYHDTVTHPGGIGENFQHLANAGQTSFVAQVIGPEPVRRHHVVQVTNHVGN